MGRVLEWSSEELCWLAMDVETGPPLEPPLQGNQAVQLSKKRSPEEPLVEPGRSGIGRRGEAGPTHSALEVVGS